MAFKKKYKRYIIYALIPVIFLLLIFVPLAAGSSSNVYAQGYGFKVGEEIKNNVTIYADAELILLSYLEQTAESITLEFDTEIIDVSAVYHVYGAVNKKLDLEIAGNTATFRDLYKSNDGAIYIKPMQLAASFDNNGNSLTADQLKGGWIEFSIKTDIETNIKVVINNVKEKS